MLLEANGNIGKPKNIFRSCKILVFCNKHFKIYAQNLST